MPCYTPKNAIFTSNLPPPISTWLQYTSATHLCFHIPLFSVLAHVSHGDGAWLLLGHGEWQWENISEYIYIITRRIQLSPCLLSPFSCLVYLMYTTAQPTTLTSLCICVTTGLQLFLSGLACSNCSNVGADSRWRTGGNCGQITD